jgi:hypothetical protein
MIKVSILPIDEIKQIFFNSEEYKTTTLKVLNMHKMSNIEK